MVTPRKIIKKPVKRRKKISSPVVLPILENVEPISSEPDLKIETTPVVELKTTVDNTTDVVDRPAGISKRLWLLIFLSVGMVFLAYIVYFYFFSNSPSQEKMIPMPPNNLLVIQTEVIIPNTKSINNKEGRTVIGSNASLSLTASDGEIVVPQAIYSIKQAYSLSLANAQTWSSNVELVFIKSLGALSPEGKAEGWQVVFGSVEKKSGYEIIITKDKIVSQKEIPSSEFGYQLPSNWYDSGEAMTSLRGVLSGNQSASVSGLNFYYNLDSKVWQYGFATSLGTTSLSVK
jgi:hypothetical protein